MPERQQRDQRPDAAAGFGHLERRVREDDHVAFAQHRDAEQPPCTASPNWRGQQLQRKRDLVEDDRRNRNHQQQKRERKRQHPQVLPAEQEQHGAGERRR